MNTGSIPLIESYHKLVLDEIFNELPSAIILARAETNKFHRISDTVSLDEFYTPVVVGGYAYNYYLKDSPLYEDEKISTHDIDIKIVVNKPLSYLKADKMGQRIANHIQYFRQELIASIGAIVHMFFDGRDISSSDAKKQSMITDFKDSIGSIDVYGHGTFEYIPEDEIDQGKLGCLLIKYISKSNGIPMEYNYSLIDTSFYIKNDVSTLDLIPQFDAYRMYFNKTLNKPSFYKLDVHSISSIVGYNTVFPLNQNQDVMGIKICNQLFMIMDTVRMISKIESIDNLHYSEYYKYCKYVVKLIQLVYEFMGETIYNDSDLNIIVLCSDILQAGDSITSNQEYISMVHTEIMQYEGSKFKEIYQNYVNAYISDYSVHTGGTDNPQEDWELEHERLKDQVAGTEHEKETVMNAIKKILERRLKKGGKKKKKKPQETTK